MVKRIIKKNYKLVLGMIIGLTISTIVAYASTIYEGNVIAYDNSNSTLSSTDVQGALDELYGVCTERVYLSNYIIDLYYDGSNLKTINIGNDTTNSSVSLNETQGIMLDNNREYRYYGSNPNNYVRYNDELWRIISVSNVKSNADDEYGELRVKIIRNEILGWYSWDSSEESVNGGQGYNNWNTADLNLELNDTYYNQKSGICYNNTCNASITCDFTSIGLNSNARKMISNALWYVSGSDPAGYANNIYDSERSGAILYSGNPDKWVGIVGLIYGSDYAYATDLSVCTEKVEWSGSSGGYKASNDCLNNDWLFDSSNYQWIINAYSADNYRSNVVGYDGSLSIGTVGIACSVKPVVYLNPNIEIKDGNGSSVDPFVIG